MGLELADAPDHSLAEVYSTTAPGLITTAERHVGFGAFRNG
jgi:hypothetical protein